MSTLNRTEAPEVNVFEKIQMPSPTFTTLKNGIPIWGINAGSQDIVKIDFLFQAGAWYQEKNMISVLANAMMAEGSKNYSRQEIAEIFDFHGAHIQCNVDQNFAYCSIICLTKHVDTIMKVTADLLLYPSFDQDELSTQIEKRRQRFVVENEKVKTMAHKRFTKSIFGDGHPYANTNVLTDFDHITRDDLVEFHSLYYAPNRCKIIVGGRYDDALMQCLEKYFSTEDWIDAPYHDDLWFDIKPTSDHKIFIEKADAMQNAIRIGRALFTRDHNDFIPMTVLTTVLGGYFGSRLMSNIREEKGYTYGIGANMAPLHYSGYFGIGTEVGSDVCDAALTEIYKEIARLRDELISVEELELVKNYMHGEIVRGMDGVFSLVECVKVLIDFELEPEYFSEVIDQIAGITPEQLQTLAQKYLQEEDLIEVVAGKSL